MAKRAQLEAGADGGWEFNRSGGSGRRSAASADELPGLLADGAFEVLDGGELRAAPERRGVAGGGNAQVRTEIAPGEIVLLVARQESGAISFHLPRQAPQRRSASAAGRVAVTFDVPVAEGAVENERRSLLSKAVRVVLVKIVDTVAGSLLENAAKFAVPFLARKLEEALWRKRTPGWVRVTADGLGNGSELAAAKPTFGAKERGLLLLHGTFSSTNGAFKNLAATGFFAEAQKLYGDRIYGFNHFTISKSPAENVKDLLTGLPDRDLEFDIITHSRGGLVARELIEGSGLKLAKARRLGFRNFVMVACPNAGTPLGSPSAWDQKLSFIANLLEMLPAPENPFTTGAAWLAEALKWVAANILGNCSGLVAMDPAGDYIGELQRTPHAPAGVRYHALVSNFHPARDWWARLADAGIDHFFKGANDLVVPTEGGWVTADQKALGIAADCVGCLGPGGNLNGAQTSIHHGGFFGNTDAVAFLVATLRGESVGSTVLDLEAELPSRAFFAKRQALPKITEAPAPEPAAASRPEPRKLSAEPAFATIGARGFARDQSLWLTVVSDSLHTSMDDEKDAEGVPMLIAQFGSARIAVPFHVSGPMEERWESVAARVRQLVDYANGEPFIKGLKPGEDDGHPDEKFLEELGYELFRIMLPGEVRTLYNVARFQQDKRRLNIIFTSMIPWVADVPWELAYDRDAGSFLSCADVRFVRNVLTPTPANRIEDKTKGLRILVISAQPSGTGRLSIEEECRGIYESFRPLIDAGLVEVEVLAGASPERLQERLRYQLDGDDFDVLHFIGHGEFDDNSGTGYLLFEDETGRPKRLSARSFLNILRGRNIRVVFLNACETGRGRQADYNRGIAMELVEDGVPIVVANQYSVIDRSASLFSLHFYACLASGLKVGDAMREARIALQYSGVEPMDWVVPVLFATNPDAQLCVARTRPSFGSKDAESQTGSLSPSPQRRSARPSGKRVNVSIWDAENSLIYRENLDATVQAFNDAQKSFAFRLERFTAPRGLWTVDKDPQSDGIAYLQAERVLGRMGRICASIGAEHLFCVTELPLRDADTTALYYYLTGCVSILSTWDLSPPLEGNLLRKAMANYVAISLLHHVSGIIDGGTSDDDPKHPIHTIGFWNDARNVAHIAGPMKITPATQREINRRIRAKKLTLEQLASIEALLRLFE